MVLPAVKQLLHRSVSRPQLACLQTVTYMYSSGQAQTFATVTITLLALVAGENGQNNEVLHISAAGSASKQMAYTTCSCTAG